MVRHKSGRNSTTSSRSPSLRHISPRPVKKYQISSTLRWVTAFDVSPGPSSKCAKLPPLRLRRSLTAVPSGAAASGRAGSCFVSNFICTKPAGESLEDRPATSSAKVLGVNFQGEPLCPRGSFAPWILTIQRRNAHRPDGSIFIKQSLIADLEFIAYRGSTYVFLTDEAGLIGVREGCFLEYPRLFWLYFVPFDRQFSGETRGARRKYFMSLQPDSPIEIPGSCAPSVQSIRLVGI
jgi:hypothetical protein